MKSLERRIRQLEHLYQSEFRATNLIVKITRVVVRGARQKTISEIVKSVSIAEMRERAT